MSISDEIVAIKGIRDGLIITLSETEEWNGIIRELASRIDERSDFFSGARITADLGARPVPKHELLSLRALLERRGLKLSVVISDSDTTINAANALDLRTSAASLPPGREKPATISIDPEEEGTQGVMLRRTLRSGRTVHSRGHVVVLGDVNPGAEIIAAGDVIIWGKLRGTVHAGADGAEDAVVCALDMSPTQLRIASYIAVSPEEKARKARPEMALVRDNQIVVEAWR